MPLVYSEPTPPPLWEETAAAAAAASVEMYFPTQFRASPMSYLGVPIVAFKCVCIIDWVVDVHIN